MPPRLHEISAPRTSISPSGSAAAAASHPSVVSWSVSATTPRPESRAARTSASGGVVPSEAVEWVWRSMGPGTRARLAASEAHEPGDGRGADLLVRGHELLAGPAVGAAQDEVHLRGACVVQSADHCHDVARAGERGAHDTVLREPQGGAGLPADSDDLGGSA